MFKLATHRAHSSDAATHEWCWGLLVTSGSTSKISGRPIGTARRRSLPLADLVAGRLAMATAHITHAPTGDRRSRAIARDSPPPRRTAGSAPARRRPKRTEEHM